jgi:hypothetical protein
MCFRGGGVGPPTQNGWFGPPPREGRHTLLTKVKGRREGVEDAVKEGKGDGVPDCEVASANSWCGTVGIESPSRGEQGWEGKTSSGGLGM